MDPEMGQEAKSSLLLIHSIEEKEHGKVLSVLSRSKLRLYIWIEKRFSLPFEFPPELRFSSRRELLKIPMHSIRRSSVTDETPTKAVG